MVIRLKHGLRITHFTGQHLVVTKDKPLEDQKEENIQLLTIRGKSSALKVGDRIHRNKQNSLMMIMMMMTTIMKKMMMMQ